MKGKLGLALVATLAVAPLEAAHVRPVRAAAVVVVRTPGLRIVAGGPVTVKKGYGKLHVEVSPERAKVYLDGRFVGHGDTTRILHAGTHRVRVVLNDGREASETVHVDAGHFTRVRLELR